ncbi:MAG: hypothetical protein K2L80_09565, partial [Muribaculaceae bacterium]|nr:hypothetical protein [Muribaculaceae bacterium]
MKKFYFLLVAMMVGLCASAADYYALHGQITGNSNWESVLLEENNGWYEYTGSFVGGEFGIKKVASASASSSQLGWIGGNANITEADKTYSFVNGGNSKSTLQGNYTFRFNPAEGEVEFVTYGGVITVNETYAIHGQITGNPGWESTDMTEVDGKWVLTIENAVAGDFGIKRMENGSQKDWYASAGAPAMAAAGEYQAKINGTNWKSTLTGKVSFSFDPETLVLTVNTDGGGDEPGPSPVTTYTYAIHGQITGNELWETVNLKEEEGLWSWTGAIVPGEFGVKVLEDGEQVDWLGSDEVSEISKAGTYGLGSGVNFTSTLEGNYTISVDPAAKTITFTEYQGVIDEVTAYFVRGTLVDGEWNDYAMTDKDGLWSVTLTVSGGEFGIKKTVNGAQAGWYAAPEATVIDAAGTYQAGGIGVTNWENALEGEYVFTFNPSTEILTVTEAGGGDEPGPGPADPYTYAIHGQITGNELWETVNLTEENGLWSWTGAIVPGEFGVKVLEDGEQVDWLGSDEVSEISKAGTYGLGSGVNFTSTLEGNYTISVDPAAKTITFTEYQGVIEDVIAYVLRGNVVSGEWDDYAMAESNGLWSVTLTVNGGEFGIKKTNNGAQAGWYAAPEATVISGTGNYKAAGIGGTNWENALEGEYVFTFDPASEILTVTSARDGVSEIAADADMEAEYFNLQGVRVENPSNGLYIVRK